MWVKSTYHTLEVISVTVYHRNLNNTDYEKFWVYATSLESLMKTVGQYVCTNSLLLLEREIQLNSLVKGSTLA